MRVRNVNLSERIWIKNKVIHCSDEEFDLAKLKSIVVQVSDLSFVNDTVRLNMDFGDVILIVPSLHKSYDMLFEKLSKCLKLDDEAYLRAMNCDISCDFTIYEQK